jgi:hypothetical protein
MSSSTNPFGLTAAQINDRLRSLGVSNPGVESAAAGGFTVRGSDVRYSEMGVADRFGVKLSRFGPETESGGTPTMMQTGSDNNIGSSLSLLAAVLVGAYLLWNWVM